MPWSFARVGSLSRGLRRGPRAKHARPEQTRRLRLAIDQLESRRALAITSPLEIGGTTVGTFTDSPTGIGNLGDAVTVSITGTKGTVIFNGGKGVADGTDIQTIEIVNASPDFQMTVSAVVQVANPVPYGSDGIVQLGKITTNNVIRGINTIRGPLTNVAATTAPPIGFNQAAPGSTLTVEGDQTAAWPVNTFIATTPLAPSSPVGATAFGTISGVGYDGTTGVTTIVYDGATPAGTTAGALTAAATVQPSFVLTSFVGVNFSNDALRGGGLFVDRVVGADTTVRGSTIQDLGIYLSQGLLSYSSIVVRNDLDATVLLGGNPGAAVDGRLLVGTATSASQLFVGPQTGVVPANSPFQITSDGDFNARVVMGQAFNGVVNVGGRAGGSWLFKRGVGPDAVLNAAAWDGSSGDNPAGVSVTGGFAGSINSVRNNSVSSETRLSVTGDLAPTARINAAGDIYLNAKGSVLGGAVISGSDVFLTVAKNFSGSLTAEDDIQGTIGGSVSGATMNTTSDIDLAIAGSVINSSLSAYSDIDLDVKGSVVNSKFNALYDGDLYVRVARDVTASSFTVGHDYDLDLIVGGNMSGSSAVAGSDVTVEVTGNVTNSQFTSVYSDVDLDVGGDLLQSKIVTADNVTLKVGRDALNNTVTGYSVIDATIGRNWSGVAQSSSDDLVFSVGGSVLKGSSFSSGEDTYLDVRRGFDGTTTSRALGFFVGGNVSAASRITAQSVTNWRNFNVGRAENVGNFTVGGQFAGILNVGIFDAAPNVQTVTLIGGGATSTARFTVGRFLTDTLVFKGDFLAHLRVLQDLEASLDFQGNVARITLGGRVGTYTTGNSIQAVPVSINVGKQLQFLNSNSYFQAATPRKSGTFYNDAISSTSFPSLAATGILTTGSYVTVLPTRPALQTLGPITPQTYAKPTAPTNFSAAGSGNGTTLAFGITVSFDAPATPGGLPVVFYEYTTDNGANWRRFSTLSQGPGQDIALPGPSGGGSGFSAGDYTVAVRATNALGKTATSFSNIKLQAPV